MRLGPAGRHLRRSPILSWLEQRQPQGQQACPLQRAVKAEEAALERAQIFHATHSSPRAATFSGWQSVSFSFALRVLATSLPTALPTHCLIPFTPLTQQCQSPDWSRFVASPSLCVFHSILFALTRAVGTFMCRAIIIKQ